MKNSLVKPFFVGAGVLDGPLHNGTISPEDINIRSISPLGRPGGRPLHLQTQISQYSKNSPVP